MFLCHLSTLKTITLRGVFQRVVQSESGDEALASYAEFKEEADAALRRERDVVWMEWAPHLCTLESKHGEIHRSRVGVIANTNNVKLKIRLARDLRRSGVKAMIKSL